MAMKIVVSPRVAFSVKGSITNEQGKPEPFDFQLTCRRLSQEELSDEQKDPDRLLVDFLSGIAENWSGVKDEDGSVLDFSDHAFRQLCSIAGMGNAIYAAYLGEMGVKAKN